MRKIYPHAINLLPMYEKDSKQVKELKRTLPIAAITSVTLFLLIFLISIAYTNANITQYNRVKRETDLIEKKIVAQKQLEQIFIISSTRLEAISQILTGKNSISPLLSKIIQLQGEGIILTSSAIDEKGNVSISLSANTHEILDSFISSLLQKEENDQILSNIQAQGITRDKKGNYILNITLKLKI